MAELHRRHPDDRERSLFASVELSLRRLPTEFRAKLGPLAVFQGGGYLPAIAQVLGLDSEKNEEDRLAQALDDVGLAEALPYRYLRFDPALAPALRSELTDAAWSAAEAAWGEAMAQFARFLYQQWFQDAKLAAALTCFDLANLLAALEFRYRTAAGATALPAGSAPTAGSFDNVVVMATRLETLLEPLDRRRALARVVDIRRRAAQQLGKWARAHVLSESASVDRLLDTGRFAEAVEAVQRQLACAQLAGESAYAGAHTDLACSHFLLGRTLRRAGYTDAALASLAEAERRFAAYTAAGDANAARMTLVCLTERASCLSDLGRLEEAAQVYAATIPAAENKGDRRSVAVLMFELGKVQSLQGLYPEALATYCAALQSFAEFGEDKMIGNAWHEIGIVHWKCEAYAAAEDAYLHSLAIKVQSGDRAGEALTLAELGNLATKRGRPEDALGFHFQAATTFADPDVVDLANEGRVRNNVANTLIQLGRYDEARRELQRAIECKKPFGHTVEPWTTFAMLSLVERAAGRKEAADQAHEQAIATYLAYRRNGGESESGRAAARICASVAQAIASGIAELSSAHLAHLVHAPDLSSDVKPILAALAAILAGSRDPELAGDPGLAYNAAAELLLLLERLAAPD